jgi:benzoyl-CoA reductase/2-hydroxyglutaryl-CoA dehydratase subunit BcrC/BadD/HgdB
MDEVYKQIESAENPYVKAWRKNGGKVLGYGCVATPVEIVEAAGVLPYRLRALGNGQTELADAHLSRFNCSFCRSVLQLGLDGTYDFLDGLIETNGCDHLRGMFENWQYEKKLPYFHYVKVPHIVTEDSMNYFVEEVRLFKKSMEDYTGEKLSDAALWKSIKAGQQVRDLMREIVTLREADAPVFSGAEVLAIYLAGSGMTAADFSSLLKSTIKARTGKPLPAPRARLMLVGSATDEIDFLRAVESQGALVVTDALCYGHRAFWPEIPTDETDPCRALAKLYLDNLLCPRMYDDFHRRLAFVTQGIDRAKVDGVVLVANKFCDVHGVDNVHLRMKLEKLGVPTLQLEKEYGAKADEGRMKTRVQAFMEQIGDRR